eukprot:NODE_2177_length_1259_cov_176.939929_g2069_i0.p1 GENE.NODE_2177_length_1259_cov_176.939929_g2069_i0~~NODE_2177_length_1259_cov_176.939929_g2069_i0.p1  ORF type:complete len:380 (+),score=83.63 NODE_2177_length_1259_cov_176.939929_g2069_i0:52-1140(+)
MSLSFSLRRFSSAAFQPLSKLAPLTGPVQVQGRRFLPDSHNPSLPLEIQAAQPEFPKAFTAPSDLSFEALAEQTRLLVDAELHVHGSLLLKNMPLPTYKEFSQLMHLLDYRTLGEQEYLKCMLGRSMTSSPIDELVRTASDDPPEYTIEPHSEYHTAGFPAKLFLYCQVAPTHGGEWPVTDIRQVYNQISPEVRQKFESLGVCYQVYYPSQENAHYNSWQGNINPSREFVEKYLADLGYEWKWQPDNGLLYWQTFPVTKEHPVTHEKAWFNQIHAQHSTFYAAHPLFQGHTGILPCHCTYGDHSEIEPEVLNHVRETVWRNTVAVPPQAQDVLIVDNLLAMHGRMSFQPGTPREVYVTVTFD